jgi:hypothetical protein
MESLRLDDSIEDILITLHKEYHLIRLLKSSRNELCSIALVMSAAQELGNEQGLSGTWCSTGSGRTSRWPATIWGRLKSDLTRLSRDSSSARPVIPALPG